MGTTATTSRTRGEEVVQLARKHIGERYVLGVQVPKDNGSWKGPWDCAEYASWLTFQVAGVLYGCDRDFGDPATADAFTGYWDRDARTLGRIVSLEEASRTPGALVLRKAAPGAFGHIVVSNGAGGTVEAHSSRDGVIASTLAGRRWDFGILIPQVLYTGGAAVAVSPVQTVIYRLTTPLMTGPKVREIQQALQAAGFDPGVIDGQFGPHTGSAVGAFQLSSGLAPDGEVGPITAKALGVVL